MAMFTYKQTRYIYHKNETVLNTLLREKVDVSYGCQQGICHSCILHSIEGSPPKAAQEGLTETQKQQNYFLSCLCYPTEELQIDQLSKSEFVYQVKVLEKRLLNHNTVLLSLSYPIDFSFKAGQFINLQSPDNITRSYSIGNSPNEQQQLELHIRLLPEGRFSGWVHHDVNVGDTIPASIALGDCVYHPEQQDQNLLLVGTGSGLAPLYGILQDALAQQHQGTIHLFHGSRNTEDLYLIEQLRQLDAEHENFSYTACLSGDIELNKDQQYSQGRVNEVVSATYKNLNNWSVYLCGHPSMVEQMKKQAFLNGANLQDIYADAFHLSDINT